MLTGKHRHFLRGLGHGLKPVVQIGRGGIDEGLVAAVERALVDHELIKVRLGDNAEVDRHDAADAIAKQTKSHVAQVLGHIVLLYRAHPNEPKIELPKPGKTAAKKSAKRDRTAD
jgi:RNA-binding protein